MRKLSGFIILFCVIFSAVHSGAQGVRINDDSGDAAQRFPCIAMHPNGPTVICWQDQRNGGGDKEDIYMQLFTRRGAPLSRNICVNDIAGGDVNIGADVAMDKHGQFVVVYDSQVDDSWDVYYRRFYANGMPKGPSQKIADNDGNGMGTIAMSPSGHYVIVWTRRLDNIYAKVFSPDGEDLSGDFPVHPPADNFQSFPTVAMHEDESFMVVWIDERSGVRRIWGRLLDRSWQPVTDPFEVSDPDHDGNAELYVPQVAAGQSGEYFVVWRNGADKRVYGRHIDADGQFLSGQMVLCENIFTEIYDISVVAHPQWDFYRFAWVGMQPSPKLLTNVFMPDHGGALTAEEIISRTGITGADVAMAHFFNTVYVWSDARNGNYDIFADWRGRKMPMRTTAASRFDGMVPLSWDPSFGYTEIRPYHIHRINPDGSHEVIATVNPADRALPNQMLDYIDRDVVNGETYQYGIQLDGEREDQIYFKEATPFVSWGPWQSEWAVDRPTIDGAFDFEKWLRPPVVIRSIGNPEADKSVPFFIKNDSTYLYICIVDGNDDLVDPANSMGIVFDEDHDGQWESSFSLGEGMLTLTNEAQSFVSFTGSYPNDLRFSSPQPASNIDFVVKVDSNFMVYECRIDLQASPLNASPGDTIGFGIWIKDPGHFYAWGAGNAGEWPQGALWDAAETLGELVLAKKPETNLIMLGTRSALDMAAVDITGDGREELIALTKGNRDADLGFSDTDGQISVFGWNDGAFGPILQSDLAPGNPSTMQIADIDADGHQDILFTCAGLKMLHNAGDGYEMADIILGADLRSFVAVDLNNDGLLDIVANNMSEDESKVSVYQQNTDHTFTFVRDLEESAGLNQIVSINWNRDANPDVLLGSMDSGRLLLLQNNGDLTLTPVYADTLAPGITGLEAGDFDSDGYDDFAVAKNSDNIRIFHNRRNGDFGESYASGYIGYCLDMAAIKIDNDPYPDLVAAPMRGNLFLYHNMGAMDFEEIDAELNNGLSHSVAVAAGDFDGNGLIDIAFASNPIEVLFDAALRFDVPTRVSLQTENAPESFRLSQNYPNPFNPTTTIAFDVTRSAHVELKVFDTLGREVATLINQKYQGGHYKAVFDARRLASGLYFYRIRMGDFQQTRKMLLVR